MIRNYLIIAFRNLIRYKSYSILNVASLAIGIATFIIVSEKINAYSILETTFRENIKYVFDANCC